VFIDAVVTYLAGNINLRLKVARLGAGTIPAPGVLPLNWANTVDFPNFDLDGNPRVMPGADVGAYEL